MRRIVVISVLLASCAPGEHTLAVDLQTDLNPGTEFVAVRTTAVADTGGAPRSAEVSATVERTYVEPGRVAEWSGFSDGDLTIDVALLDAAGDVVVTRTVRTRLTSDSLVLAVVTRDCRGVSCPRSGDPTDATTCFGGRCVDPRCVDDDCGPAECELDTDCTAVAACATGRCESGVCLFDIDRGCPASEWCNPDTGCRPRSSLPDAGASDAGPPDAGCTPQCDDRACGADPACGTNCGDCDLEEVCLLGACQPLGAATCVPGTATECVGRSEGWSGSECCVFGDVDCVDGDGTFCDEERWTGERCCVDSDLQCVDGGVTGCDGEGVQFTGSLCCVGSDLQCVEGNVTGCDGAKVEFTGALCCVGSDLQCVEGGVLGCDDPDVEYTGDLCCVASDLQCVAGDDASCTGPAMLFTGELCCVNDDAQCVAGNETDCAGSGLLWTGDVCCVQGASICEPLDVASCTGRWTGDFCCDGLPG